MKSPVAPIEPVTLEGQRVRLEPLALSHLEALSAVAFDEELWRWIPAPVRNQDGLRAYLEEALDAQAKGTMLPFATVLKETARAIGSTRFGAIERQHRRIEIGWTWIGRPWQRTFVNTEAKYLMLRHAFETLGCIRVELKTDALNEASRRAILRLGATEEGIFRQHMVTLSGRLRDTAYYSILDREWPAVKTNLEAKLGIAPLLGPLPAPASRGEEEENPSAQSGVRLTEPPSSFTKQAS